MLYRLQQEARTASALNHPNIVTVYEIGEFDGEPFIASEFIDGATLRAAMQRNAIDVAAAIEVAIQVASALVAAHAAGVVHRDLKPGNIMLRPDGYVKVIDFGLAKQITKAPASPLGSDFSTRTGSVIGTVDYMSPEQARGEQIDHRTDIWSLGVVLYEMVAQRRPFEGPTDSHIVVSILDNTPPPLPETVAVPSGLPPILQRALAKDPRKRYSSVGEMLNDLQQISPGSRSGSGVQFGDVGRRQRSIGRKIIAAGTVVLFLALAVGWWWLKRRPEWFQIGSVRQLTFNGRTRLATISPDGNYLAFVLAEAEGEEALYLRQIDSSTEEVRIPARRVLYVGLTFSPDSKFLYETEKDEAKMGRLYAMPILGARPSVPLIENIDGPVSFSPGGERFAFVRFSRIRQPGGDQNVSALFVAWSNTSDPKPRKLVSLSDFTMSRIVGWSPHGDRIAAFEYSNLTDHSGQAMLDLIDLNGGQSRRPLPWRTVNQPLWIRDGHAIVASAASNTESDTQAQLREIALPAGEIRDVTRDLAGYRSESMTADGDQIAALRMETRASLWISAKNDFTRGENTAAETEGHPTLAWTDGTHLLVNSRRGGFPNLWVLDTARRNRTSITNEPYVEQEGSPVAGTNSIVFVSNRSGQSHLWRFDPESNQYVQLTFGTNYDESPSVSPDGKLIVYTSWDGATPHLRSVSIDGAVNKAVGDYLARYPQISPDGQWIACEMQDPVRRVWTVGVIPIAGSGQLKAIAAAQTPFRWSVDGKSLTTAITDNSGATNVWAIPLQGAGSGEHSARQSGPRKLTQFEDETITAFAWSKDGARLACIRASIGADVVLFKRQR